MVLQRALTLQPSTVCSPQITERNAERTQDNVMNCSFRLRRAYNARSRVSHLAWTMNHGVCAADPSRCTLLCGYTESYMHTVGTVRSAVANVDYRFHTSLDPTFISLLAAARHPLPRSYVTRRDDVSCPNGSISKPSPVPRQSR